MKTLNRIIWMLTPTLMVVEVRWGWSLHLELRVLDSPHPKALCYWFLFLGPLQAWGYLAGPLPVKINQGR